jgi:hypothetical protein
LVIRSGAIPSVPRAIAKYGSAAEVNRLGTAPSRTAVSSIWS